MDWLDNWNSAMTYIDENIETEIDIEKAARLAGCSAFHFQKMFSYILDISLTEYIRRRKMTMAAVDLRTTNLKVVDVALKYGYDSPTAFNRAFQGIHGIAPSVARQEGIIVKAYPPIRFKITVKGDAEMNYRIERKNSFRVIGIKERFTGGIDESFKDVPKLWGKAYEMNLIPRLCNLMNTEIKGILGICTPDTCKEFDYYIAVATDSPSTMEFDEYTIPESEWAIFECCGPIPTAIQSLQKRIVSEWLPSSGYEYSDAPDIEVYYDGDQSSENYKSEVWIPIKKK